MSLQRSRLLHLDMLRLIAIYLVIFNHTGNRGFMLFSERMDSPLYFPYMIISIFCKIAVPIFFMISGALLLKKEESIKHLFTKRILRMTIVLVLISVPYYIWLKRENGISIASFLTYIYENSASTALWYLYSYIALLIMLPFLRSMVKNMKQNDYLYLFVGHLIFVGLLPCLEYCLWSGNITSHASFNPFLFTAQNIFYALMGYYLENVHEEKLCCMRNIGTGIGFSVIALIVTALMTNWQITTVGGDFGNELLQRFFNCFISIPAMTVYYLAKCLALKIQHTQKKLSVLGNAVFGVYLIEKFVRTLTDSVYTLFVPFVGSMIASFIWCFAVLCAGLLIVITLKYIPIIKKLVNKFI